MIVEDDPDDRDIYTDAIAELGISSEFRIFEHGQLALDYLYTTKEQPFIIISDINMPGTDGCTLLQSLRSDPES